MLGERANKYLTQHDFLYIWEQFEPSCKYVLLEGAGEAFLNPEIYGILQYLRHIRTYMDTNGQMLDPEAVVLSGLKELVFSIDGYDQESYERYRVGGSYRKAIDNMKSVLKTKERMQVATPEVKWKSIMFSHLEEQGAVLAYQADEIGVIVEFAQPNIVPKYGREQWERFQPLRPMWRRIKDIDWEQHWVRPVKDFSHCILPIIGPYVAVNGNLSPCCAIDPDEFEPRMNLFEQDLKDIWWSTELADFRRRVLVDRFQEEQCKMCSVNLPEVDDE